MLLYFGTKSYSWSLFVHTGGVAERAGEKRIKDVIVLFGQGFALRSCDREDCSQLVVLVTRMSVELEGVSGRFLFHPTAPPSRHVGTMSSELVVG